MLRLRPFRTPDAKSIITWTSEPEEFYKWSAGIMGDYPVSEKRLLEAVSARCYCQSGEKGSGLWKANA